MPLYITPTRLGHLSERWGGGWAVLPYCARPVELEGAAAAEGEGAAVQAEKESGADDDDAPVVVARRRLIAFASTASEQERLRRALYASCC